ncbi:uncharacterized protein LOC101864506 [Aplysia californica]|uniref:Uncharacterized protein LOC101864506 n=1 Tax=Aplysia californica TaxID=6500 RepID=A0ABM0KB59_APLCA|nr:uncharacterized protein LOC101864506 [Aplysia californica]
METSPPGKQPEQASGLEEEGPVHTVEDDIRYQMVKGNQRRSSFVSSDHQILTQSQQERKLIERTERMASADYRRQQASLVGRLEKLQHRQQTLGLAPRSPGNVADKATPPQRRLSMPAGSLHLHHQQQQQQQHLKVPPHSEDSSPTSPLSPARSPRRHASFTPAARSPRDSVDHHVSGVGRRGSGEERGGGGSDGKEENEDNYNDDEEEGEGDQSPVSGTPLSHSQHMLHRARRMSHEIQAETAKMALDRLNTIVAESRRRATVAQHASPDDVIPSKRDLMRIQAMVKEVTHGEQP